MYSICTVQANGHQTFNQGGAVMGGGGAQQREVMGGGGAQQRENLFSSQQRTTGFGLFGKSDSANTSEIISSANSSGKHFFYNCSQSQPFLTHSYIIS